MGKSSSAKKVARVARSSGAPRRDQLKLGFPAVIVVVMVLGVGLVGWARESRDIVAADPAIGDHWHAAYGIYVCDGFEAPLSDVGPDRTGLHTHNDGLIHIHPFSSAAAGTRATFNVWGESVGVSFDGSSFTLPDGRSFEDGQDCNGEPAQVALYRWAPGAGPGDEPLVYTDDIGSVRFTEDGEIFTLAVVPEGTDVPQPPSVEGLANPVDEIQNPEAPADSDAIPEEYREIEFDFGDVSAEPGAQDGADGADGDDGTEP